MAFLTESTLRGPVLFKSRCTFSCVDTLCHNFELNFGFLDEFERKAPLGGRMRNWIIWMPFQIVNFLGILKKFTGIIDDSMRVVQERVLNSKTCQKMNYNHRYSCIHVDGLAQRSFNPQKVAMWLQGSTRVFSLFSYSFMHNFSYMKICRLLFFK